MLKFRKFLLVAAATLTALLMGCPSSTVAFAQDTTTVSATVVDSDNTTWTGSTAGGTWSAVLVNPYPGQMPTYLDTGLPVQTTFPKAALSGSGTFSASIPNNSAINPANTQWVFTFCPQATFKCSDLQAMTISGSTQDISTQIKAQIIPPRIALQAINIAAYNTTEIITIPSLGSQFFNIGAGQNQYWNGTSWVGSSGSGNTTSSSLVTGNFPLATGTNSIGDSGIKPSAIQTVSLDQYLTTADGQNGTDFGYAFNHGYCPTIDPVNGCAGATTLHYVNFSKGGDAKFYTTLIDNGPIVVDFSGVIVRPQTTLQSNMLSGLTLTVTVGPSASRTVGVTGTSAASVAQYMFLGVPPNMGFQPDTQVQTGYSGGNISINLLPVLSFNGQCTLVSTTYTCTGIGPAIAALNDAVGGITTLTLTAPGVTGTCNPIAAQLATNTITISNANSCTIPQNMQENFLVAGTLAIPNVNAFMVSPALILGRYSSTVLKEESGTPYLGEFRHVTIMDPAWNGTTNTVGRSLGPTVAGLQSCIILSSGIDQLTVYGMAGIGVMSGIDCRDTLNPPRGWHENVWDIRADGNYQNDLASVVYSSPTIGTGTTADPPNEYDHNELEILNCYGPCLHLTTGNPSGQVAGTASGLRQWSATQAHIEPSTLAWNTSTFEGEFTYPVSPVWLGITSNEIGFKFRSMISTGYAQGFFKCAPSCQNLDVQSTQLNTTGGSATGYSFNVNVTSAANSIITAVPTGAPFAFQGFDTTGALVNTPIFINEPGCTPTTASCVHFVASDIDSTHITIYDNIPTATGLTGNFYVMGGYAFDSPGTQNSTYGITALTTLFNNVIYPPTLSQAILGGGSGVFSAFPPNLNHVFATQGSLQDALVVTGGLFLNGTAAPVSLNGSIGTTTHPRCYVTGGSATGSWVNCETQTNETVTNPCTGTINLGNSFGEISCLLTGNVANTIGTQSANNGQRINLKFCQQPGNSFTVTFQGTDLDPELLGLVVTPPPGLCANVPIQYSFLNGAGTSTGTYGLQGNYMFQPSTLACLIGASTTSAACAKADHGIVKIPAGTGSGTFTVNTTAIGPNDTVAFTPVATGVQGCTTTPGNLYSVISPSLGTITSWTSFVINLATLPLTNAACLQYEIHHSLN